VTAELPGLTTEAFTPAPPTAGWPALRTASWNLWSTLQIWGNRLKTALQSIRAIQVLLDLAGETTVMQSTYRGQVGSTSLPATSSTRTAWGLSLPWHSGPAAEPGMVTQTGGPQLTLSCR